MKRLLFSCVAVLALHSTYAQIKSNNLFEFPEDQVKHLTNIQALVVNHNQTHIKPKKSGPQRLIAQVYDQGNAGIDSITYHYLGTEVSDYNYNNLIAPGYSAVMAPNLAPAVAHGFGQASTDVSASTIKAYSNGTNYYNCSANYDATQRMQRMVREDRMGEENIIESTEITYGYNSAPTTITNLIAENGKDSKTNYKRSLSYNDRGQIIGDLSQYADNGQWMDLSSISYQYGANGLIAVVEVFGADGINEKQEFQYDAKGRITTINTYQQASDESYVLYVTDKFSYTEGIDYIIGFEENRFENGTLIYGTKIIQTPNADGKPSKIEAFTWMNNQWIPNVSGVYSYNAFGNPISLNLNNHFSGRSTALRFYYEPLNEEQLSFEELLVDDHLRVYPNPFSNSLIVKYDGQSEQKVLLSLVDIAGKTMYNESITVVHSPNIVALPQLPAGVYYVQITDAKGNMHQQRLIKK
jgi:hypothetical protein